MTERCHLFKLKQVLCSGKQTTSRDRFANQLPNQCMQKTTAFPLHISKQTTLTASMCSYVNCTRNHGNCMQKLDANYTVNLVFKRGSNLATLHTEESSSNYNVLFKPLRAKPRVSIAVVLKYFPAVNVPAHWYRNTFFFNFNITRRDGWISIAWQDACMIFLNKGYQQQLVLLL